jgi:hypothetical protein
MVQSPRGIESCLTGHKSSLGIALIDTFIPYLFNLVNNVPNVREKVIGKVFKTTTGKKLAEKLYLT